MIKTIPLPWTTVAVDTTSETPFPATGWMPALQVQKVRRNFEMRARTGNLMATIGYQVANVENAGDTPVAIDDCQSSMNVYYGATPTDISSATLNRQLIRFVWMVKLSSGSTMAVARLGGSVDYTG